MNHLMNKLGWLLLLFSFLGVSALAVIALIEVNQSVRCGLSLRLCVYI